MQNIDEKTYYYNNINNSLKYLKNINFQWPEYRTSLRLQIQLIFDITIELLDKIEYKKFQNDLTLSEGRY